jgi:Uma2 family endonuclease
MSASELYHETITLPRAVRFPVELIPPDDFDPERTATWPQLPGRLEYVEGRLLFMPPCGDLQQDTTTDIIVSLGTWSRSHADFVVGGNEAGMRLGGDTRAADVAVWRRADLGQYTGGVRRAPPVLAVEVAGRDESEALLREKANWYLRAGVALVWIVLPLTREVLAVSAEGEVRVGGDDRLPTHDALPHLDLAVAELFWQVAGAPPDQPR